MKFFAVALAACCFAVAASAAPTLPCREAPNGKALDFWVGDWNVVAAKDGSPQGTNRIERLLDGCAIVEHWHGTDVGDDGMSLFSFDARLGLWDQVWVAQDTSRPGGLKNKHLTAVDADGSVRFQGTLFVRPGLTVQDRTTLIPLKDGRVRQTIEISRDGGASWTVNFDAYYVPMKS